jgi:hypothetical protein
MADTSTGSYVVTQDLTNDREENWAMSDQHDDAEIQFEKWNNVYLCAPALSVLRKPITRL